MPNGVRTDFGLRAVDQRVRDRIVATLHRVYEGVNMDFRTEEPTDFALYELVTLTGVDPNNMGLFGYDNSPGKDNGNVRLYDKLGGVNAVTQQDGYPGFGGVFLRSLMGFSKHPGSFAKSVPGADPMFDDIFDPFRPDQDGTPVTAGDLGENQPTLTDGYRVPARWPAGQDPVRDLRARQPRRRHARARDRPLARPRESVCRRLHNAGDAPARLMDSGGDCSFIERAELMGQAPAVFCDDEYAYLREILPSSDPPNDVTRPTCY